MKKTMAALLIASLVCASVSPAFAGGDKNRGDKGKGKVVQVQVKK